MNSARLGCSLCKWEVICLKNPCATFPYSSLLRIFANSWETRAGPRTRRSFQLGGFSLSFKSSKCTRNTFWSSFWKIDLSPYFCSSNSRSSSITCRIKLSPSFVLRKFSGTASACNGLEPSNIFGFHVKPCAYHPKISKMNFRKPRRKQLNFSISYPTGEKNKLQHIISKMNFRKPMRKQINFSLSYV